MFLVQDSWQLLLWIIGVQHDEWNVSPFWEAIDQLVYKFEALRGCQILQMVAKSFYQCRFLVWSDHILRWINTNECYGCLKVSRLLCIDFVKYYLWPHFLQCTKLLFWSILSFLSTMSLSDLLKSKDWYHIWKKKSSIRSVKQKKIVSTKKISEIFKINHFVTSVPILESHCRLLTW